MRVTIYQTGRLVRFHPQKRRTVGRSLCDTQKGYLNPTTDVTLFQLKTFKQKSHRMVENYISDKVMMQRIHK